MKEDLNIDRLFRKGLHEYSMQPPGAVWERLESDLQKTGKKPIFPLYMKMAAAVALLIGITSITFIFVQKDTDDIGPEYTQQPILKDSKHSGSNPDNIEPSVSLQVKPVEQHRENNTTNKLAEKNTVMLAEYPVTDYPDVTEKSVNAKTENLLTDATPRSASLHSERMEKINLNQENQKTVALNDLILEQNILALEAEKQAGRNDYQVWSVGGQAGPQYTYRDASIKPSSDQPFTDYDGIEEGIVAFAGGFNLQLESNKRWAFQSGIHYSKIGLETSNLVLAQNGSFTSIGAFDFEPLVGSRNGETEVEIITSAGDISFSRKVFQNSPELNYTQDDFVSGPLHAEQYFEFIEVPFVIKYKLIDQSFGVNLSGGLWTNFLIGNNAFATDYKGYYEEGPTNHINKINYIGSVGFGISYPVTTRLQLNVDPVFKYYLSPINNDNETETHPYSLGVMTGINYSF
jgi:hypothetical protein